MTDEIRPEPVDPEAGQAVAEAERPAAEGEPPAAEGEPPAAEAAEGAEPKLHLSQAVEIRDIGPCKKHITVTVERADIQTLLEKKYSELVVDANVRGFRPGKAPRRIIERRFQKEVNEQVLGEVLLASLEQLAEEHNLSPLSPPNLDPNKIEIPKEGPLVYEFDVEVRPEFDLPDYKGLKLKRPVQEFSDADVDQEMRKVLEPYGQVVPKPDAADGTPPVVEPGDVLTVDLTTRVGNQVLSELKDLRLRVDARLAFKDAVADRFAEQIKGAAAGQSRTIDIHMSEASAEAGLRGRSVQGIFEVKDIKIIRPPDLTPEICQRFGVRNEDQLHELIRAALERRLVFQQREAIRAQVVAQLGETSRWDLPRDLLVRQARKSVARRIMELREAGYNDEQIRARQRLLEQDAVQSTARSLKEHFVLQKLAEVAKIEVTEEDIDDEIDRLAAQNEESPRRLRARLEKDDLIDALATQILERKALDLVLQSAEFEDMPIGKAEEDEVGTVEEQAVPGEMQDVTAAPPEAAAEQAPAEPAPAGNSPS